MTKTVHFIGMSDSTITKVFKHDQLGDGVRNVGSLFLKIR